MGYLVLNLGEYEREIYMFPMDIGDKKDVITIGYNGNRKGNRPQIKVIIKAPPEYKILRGSIVEKKGGIEKLIEKIKSGEVEL